MVASTTNGSLYRNYETSVAVGALIKANQDGRYASALKRAEAFFERNPMGRGEKASRLPIQHLAEAATANISGPTFLTPLSRWKL